LLQQIEQHRISIINLPPAYWQQICQAWSKLPAARGARSSLRLVILGGEQLPPEALRLWQQTPWRDVRVLNAYGPTETTITATLYDTSGFPLQDAEQLRVPIGRPLPNRRAYLLDRAGQLVPMGVVGELYLGGESLARGYLKRAALTAERFVPDPFSGKPGARLYRTGDLARLLPDGTIEVLGRADQQVKLRGFRIELGEIEAVLSQHPGVGEVAVLLREKPGTEKMLVAYVVARAGHSLEPQAVRRYLQERLPAYMVPGGYVLLDALPWLSSGKLDRQALLSPRYTQCIDAQPKEGPRTPLETVVAQAWSQALNIESPGIHDDFFALGGHSLLAMQIALQLQATTHVELPLRSFFEAPTIAGIAKVITQLQQQETAPKMPALGAFSREAYRVSASSSASRS
jgi:acyl-coenzyme A synthetase/AMP-(fatty) acid ligase/acyl carrier protein